MYINANKLYELETGMSVEIRDNYITEYITDNERSILIEKTSKNKIPYQFIVDKEKAFKKLTIKVLSKPKVMLFPKEQVKKLFKDIVKFKYEDEENNNLYCCGFNRKKEITKRKNRDFLSEEELKIEMRREYLLSTGQSLDGWDLCAEHECRLTCYGCGD